MLALLVILVIDVTVTEKLDGHRMLFAALATVAVLGLSQLDQQQLGQHATWRAMARLGDDSYALYLAHPLVLSVGTKLALAAQARAGLSALIAAALLVAAASVLARLLHVHFERPMHQRTNAWVRRHWPAP